VVLAPPVEAKEAVKVFMECMKMVKIPHILFKKHEKYHLVFLIFQNACTVSKALDFEGV
jgi:hypothetical protein